MNHSIAVRLLIAIALGFSLAGCESRLAVTRYGPTAFSYPEDAVVQNGSPGDFANAFEAGGFMGRSKSAKVGEAHSSWGTGTFQMNGREVVVRGFEPAGQPRFILVSVDGEYDTRMGRAISDWMIQQSGLRERWVSFRQPKRMPEPAAHFYALSLFGFDADAGVIAEALKATAAAEGWTANEDKLIELDAITIGRYVFTDAEGQVVTVETFSPLFRQTLVEVTYPSPDPNGPLKVFNGVRDRLSLPIRTR